MTVTNLAGTMWRWRSDMIGTQWIQTLSFDIDFYSTATGTKTLYHSISFINGSYGYDWTMIYDNVTIIANGAWNYSYPQACDIQYVVGEDADNLTLIGYMEDFAELLSQPAVIIQYGQNIIGTLSEAGAKQLETNATFCTDDIIVKHQPQGGGVTAVSCAVQGQAWYTDANMSVQTSNSGQNLTAALGSIIFCKPERFPEPGSETYGVTTLTSSGTSYIVYEVTG